MWRLASFTLGALLLAGLGCARTPANAYMATPGGGERFSRGAWTLGQVRLAPDVCSAVPENRPDESHLDEQALVGFLQRQGLQASVFRARADLVYVDVQEGSVTTRLRVAVLDDAHAARQDLHNAVLQHGQGSWGVRRSNVAVLAPIGDLDQILAFAGRTRLACWGVLTVAGLDDDFVIAGGYTEF